MTKTQGKTALEYYNTDMGKTGILVADAKKIDIEPVAGNTKNGNYILAKIDGKDFSVDVRTGEKKEIETVKGTNISFPIDIGNDKYILNKTGGVRVLDLKTGKIVGKGKLTSWPGNFAYPLNKNKTLIINVMTDRTFVADNKTNKVSEWTKLSGKFYHNFPHQLYVLDDGKILLRYVEMQSVAEKSLGKFGKLWDMFMISACSGNEGAFCIKFNSSPYYSHVNTEVWGNKVSLH